MLFLTTCSLAGATAMPPWVGICLGLLLVSCGVYFGYSFARREVRVPSVSSGPSSPSQAGEPEPKPPERSHAESPVIAGLSHEIRTPLNGIAGMTNFLAQSELDEGQKECVQTIQSCVDTLLTLVNDILDFSKIESGRIRMESIDFDLRVTLEEALDVFAVHAQGRGVALLLDLPESGSLCFRGDPYRLRQIVLNFVSNAIKFTPEAGQVTVSVTRLAEGEDATQLRLSVIDTGIGVPHDKRSTLFEPFEQADDSTTREYGGTGLGLSICRGLAQCMGGEIGLESESGAGSTFWVDLELSHPAESEAPKLVEFDRAPVLVVTPNASALALLTRQLEAWNVEVSTAASLEQVEERFGDLTPRIALFDQVLLDQSLADWAERLKSRSGGDRTTLCLMYGKGISSKKEEALRSAFTHTLFKPLKQRKLLALLETALRNGVTCPPAALPNAFQFEQAEMEQLLQETSFRRRIRILVVDDNAVNRLVAKKMLLKLGYQAELVVDGKEAVEAVRRSPFDLILMDRQMPVMDGVEATRIIREREGDGRRTPIIALTADGMETARTECLAAGMDDFLVKPVTGEDLAVKITRWVNCFQR